MDNAAQSPHPCRSCDGSGTTLFRDYPESHTCETCSGDGYAHECVACGEQFAHDPYRFGGREFCERECMVEAQEEMELARCGEHPNADHERTHRGAA